MHPQPFTSREVKMIKQQQKLLEKLQKKAEKEADRRRKQEARRRRRDEEELRKKEGRKKIKRAKVLDYVTITSSPNCSQINVSAIYSCLHSDPLSSFLV